MKIQDICESTTAGAVASVAMPIGSVQKRNPTKKSKKKVSEGKMKELSMDLKELTDAEFKKKYGKTKDEVRKSLKEDEIVEQDLILVPGQIKGKDKSFVPHEKDRRDHEVEMARSELFAAAKDAQRIYKMLQGRTEDEGLMGWQQSYITLAADYLNSVADSLEHKHATEGAGVLAGGAGNLEESKCPKCGGPAFSEESIAEAKDACYHKVKSRYKVWPSAYASGALVKCRKVGASNWGNKSKK